MTLLTTIQASQLLCARTQPSRFARGPALWCAFAYCVASAVAMANPQQVHFWLGGEDPVTVQDKHRDSPADFMALFSPGASWSQSSKRVNAFKISMQFALRGRESDLATLIADLHRRKIALGIEMGMLRNDRGCGRGEGYMSKELLSQAMKRIADNGGTLDYVTMDEVVFFGHIKTWPDQPGQVPCLTACKRSHKRLQRMWF